MHILGKIAFDKNRRTVKHVFDAKTHENVIQLCVCVSECRRDCEDVNGFNTMQNVRA